MVNFLPAVLLCPSGGQSRVHDACAVASAATSAAKSAAAAVTEKKSLEESALCLEVATMDGPCQCTN